jgi:hypothetical protein
MAFDTTPKCQIWIKLINSGTNPNTAMGVILSIIVPIGTAFGINGKTGD